ncbi:MAG: VWA domain-containing protein [Bacteroidetes bacterium]|nr:VWA domain-containing protein [Bacteroidota bacterium]
MELDEILFKRIAVWLKRKRKDTENKDAIFLHELKPRLALISRALCNDPIEIVPAIGEGGWKGLTFYLPDKMGLFSSLELNLRFYIFRVFFLSKQRELGLNYSVDNDAGLEESRAAAEQHAPEILGKIQEEFQHFDGLHDQLLAAGIDSHWLYGKWMGGNKLYTKDELDNINDVTGKSGDQKITTEIDSKPVEEMTTIQVDEEAQENFTLTHNFEKVETAEEFDDIWRDFDGDDNLEDDANALDDLNLKHTVRVDDVVHSIYKADFAGQLTIAESKSLKETGFYYSYPEWNGKKQEYRADFCRVYPLLFKSYKSEYARNTIAANRRNITSLKKNLAHFHNATAQVKKVSQGDTFDLDQVTDMYVDIHSRVTPDENIYISRRKRKKELSILFLMDLSLSGDSYVGGQRVIDIAKQSVIILGEVFSEFDVEFQIDGFFSKTRSFCSYITMKHFKDRWSSAMVNVGAISPQGFTRIGPAIRHAGFLMGKRSSKSKWIIVLSDGKPNDYDRYEGTYGISDIKKAISELHQDNIQSYAVAIEEQAKYYLPQMFGINHYSILSDHKKLPASIMKLYSKIAMGA